jgi:hypothetical protein
MVSSRHWTHVHALTIAASVECQCQPLEDEALEQPALLAELSVPKAHRLDRGVAFPSRT